MLLQLFVLLLRPEEAFGFRLPLAFGLPATPGIIDIEDIIHCFDHEKSSYISQLIHGKSRNLQQLLKYFNETINSVSDLLLSVGVLPIIFVLYSKDLLFIILLLLILLLAALFSFALSFTSSL